MAGVVVVAFGAGALGISFALQSAHASSTALATLLPADASVNALLASLVDEETGERGYVITGETRFLQPYDAAIGQVPVLVGELRHQLSGHQSALQDLATVDARYRVWITEFATTQLNDVRRGDDAAAIESEKSGVGKQLFDSLRAAIAALSGEIASEEHAADTHVHDLQEATVWLVATMTSVLLAGALVGMALVRRWIVRPIERLESEVREVGAGAINREVQPFGPREIFSLGANVEAMRLRVREERDENAFLRGVAETLQRSLLPEVLPEPEGFEIRARYMAGVEGVEVGGDWYNVRLAGHHRSFFAVGDVSGRGVQAAALMASLHHAIEAYAAEDPRPDSVLNRLSRLSDINHHGRFATVLCGLVDADAARVTIANAGHPSAVLVNGGQAQLLGPATGPPIGLGHDRYGALEVPVLGPATLISYTDGLVERRDESITTGIERLRGAAEVPLPLDDLLDHLVLRLVPEGAGDDVVLLALRWEGGTARP